MDCAQVFEAVEQDATEERFGFGRRGSKGFRLSPDFPGTSEDIDRAAREILEAHNDPHDNGTVRWLAATKHMASVPARSYRDIAAKVLMGMFDVGPGYDRGSKASVICRSDFPTSASFEILLGVVRDAIALDEQPAPTAPPAGEWQALRLALDTARAAEVAYGEGNGAWHQAYLAVEAGGPLIPDEIGDQMDRLADARCDAEEAVINCPAPDVAAMAWKIEYARGRWAHETDLPEPWWIVILSDLKRLADTAPAPVPHQSDLSRILIAELDRVDDWAKRMRKDGTTDDELDAWGDASAAAGKCVIALPNRPEHLRVRARAVGSLVDSTSELASLDLEELAAHAHGATGEIVRQILTCIISAEPPVKVGFNEPDLWKERAEAKAVADNSAGRRHDQAIARMFAIEAEVFDRPADTANALLTKSLMACLLCFQGEVPSDETTKSILADACRLGLVSVDVVS